MGLLILMALHHSRMLLFKLFEKLIQLVCVERLLFSNFICGTIVVKVFPWGILHEEEVSAHNHHDGAQAKFHDLLRKTIHKHKEYYCCYEHQTHFPVSLLIGLYVLHNYLLQLVGPLIAENVQLYPARKVDGMA